MTDGRHRQPAGDKTPHAVPKEAAILATPRQRAIPEASHLESKEKQRWSVHAHAREQGLNDEHFDRFLRHFREALNEVGVEAQRVEKVTKLLESKRNAVLSP